MKVFFEADTLIEAHMICNMLEQEDIPTEILGEYLQGGMGELQAGGLVRIATTEEHYATAVDIVSTWEKEQPNVNSENHIKKANTSNFIVFALGLITGMAGTFYYFHSPSGTDGIDHSNDGVLDERWIYQGNYPNKHTRDRNFDRQVDQISHFDARGRIKYTESDDDFNGEFDSRYEYNKGSVIQVESDFDHDGKIDIRETYENDILSSVSIYDKVTNTPRKKKFYKNGKLIASDFDATGDGKYKRTHYDELEEAI